MRDASPQLLRSGRTFSRAAIAAAIDEQRDHDAASALVRQLMFIDKFRDEVRAAEELLSRPREASA